MTIEQKALEPATTPDVRELVEQTEALLAMNTTGQVTRRVPELAVDLLHRFIATLTTLSAENVRLKASDAEWGRLHQVVIEERAAALRDVSRLKAEVERLTKALSEQVDRDISGIFTPQDAGEAVAVAWPRGTRIRVDHDGFEGYVLDPYTTLEGKRGQVCQLAGARVVHVYGEKWLQRVDGPAPPIGEPTEAEVQALALVLAREHSDQAVLAYNAGAAVNYWNGLAHAAILASRKGRAGE